MWTVMTGQCTVDSQGCLLSTNYPNRYPNSDRCDISVIQAAATPIQVKEFNTEKRWDILKVNGISYSGSGGGPQGVTPTGTITWTSDQSQQQTGWKLCPQAAPSCVGTVVGDGSTYRGCLATTRSGLPCQAWSNMTDFNPANYPNSGLEGNSCRNPNGVKTTIWCFTSMAGDFEYCEVPIWTVTNGACVVDAAGCATSPNYPSEYSNSQRCDFSIDTSRTRAIQVVSFDTEPRYDVLWVNGWPYYGTAGPDGVTPTSITWTSDITITKPGWKLCFVSQATTVPTSSSTGTTTRTTTKTTTTTTITTTTVSTTTTLAFCAFDSLPSEIDGSLCVGTTPNNYCALRCVDGYIGDPAKVFCTPTGFIYVGLPSCALVTTTTTSTSTGTTTSSWTGTSTTRSTTTSTSATRTTSTTTSSSTSRTASTTTSTTASSSSTTTTHTWTSSTSTSLTSTTSTTTTRTTSTSSLTATLLAVTGQLALTAVNAAELAAALSGLSTARDAVKKAIASSLGLSEYDIRIVSVTTARRLSNDLGVNDTLQVRRLASQVVVSYEITVPPSSPVTAASVTSSSADIASQISTELQAANSSWAVANVVVYQPDTTTTSSTTTSLTVTRTVTSTATATSTTSTTISSTTSSSTSRTGTTTTTSSLTGTSTTSSTSSSSTSVSTTRSTTTSHSTTSTSTTSSSTTSSSTTGTSTTSSSTTSTSTETATSTTTSTRTTSSTRTSTSSTTTTPAPVDCVWANWGSWSSCSSPCNGGQATRQRTYLHGEMYGGAPCTGPNNDTQVCNTFPCTACPPGFYARELGLAENCIPCDAGTYSNVSGVVGQGSCLQCPPGTTSTDGDTQCEACVPGTAAKQTPGTVEPYCSKCDPGKFAAVSGLTACSACPAGTYNMDYGVTACSDCKPGTYNAQTGATSLASCTNCPVGKFIDQPGSVGLANCTDCAAGKYAASTGSTACRGCPEGRYGTAVGAVTASGCMSCPEGRYAEVQGLSECTACAAGRYLTMTGAARANSCQSCPTGTFASNTGSSACDACPFGRYGPAYALAICEACPGGSFSRVAGAVQALSCQSCGAGQYSGPAAQGCTPCPPGTAGPTGGLASCTNCSAGMYQASSGFSACNNCTVGTYRPDNGNATFCLPCAPGRANPVPGARDVQSCTPCARGTYLQDAGQSLCAACNPGRSSDPGATACYPCAPGSFTSIWASSACSTCAAGRFSNESGVSFCSWCPVGTYRADGQEPSTSCQPCQAGRYSAEVGGSSLSSCQACPPGSYSDLDGASACTDCRAGSFSSRGGTSSCQACPSASMSPRGAISCCPVDSEAWPVARGTSVYTPPGKSQAPIYRLKSCSDTSGASAIKPAAQADMSQPGVAYLGTLEQSTERSCVSLECDCYISLNSDRETLKPGAKITATALVSTSINGTQAQALYTCPAPASVVVAGFGCAHDTLMYFLAGLTAVLAFTVLTGLALEQIQRARVKYFLEVSLDIELPPRAAEALPTVEILRDNIARGLEAPLDKLPKDLFSAWIVHSGADDTQRTLHAEFALRAPRRELGALRRKVRSIVWGPARSLASMAATKSESPSLRGLAAWSGARIEAQPPAVVQVKGNAPGDELVDGLERLVLYLFHNVFCRGAASQVAADAQLHREVADQVLERLMSRTSRLLLSAQFVANCGAIGFIPWYAYQRMATCEDGYPFFLHIVWLAYILGSNAFSVALLRYCLGGPQAGEFCRRFWVRILFRVAASCVMLSDIYQDATFPVIAKKCGFDLWFVCAWLVALGCGLMQVFAQVWVVFRCYLRYQSARTPEERERILVEGVFLALRGSDNLPLVFAVRPAVEQRLGGRSSWAMKMVEARIMFFRFVFEDTEQSALQMVFLLFYEDAALRDKVWVALSISTSVLLSVTLLVQCLPEVRDFLWYRCLVAFPGARLFPRLRSFWLLVALLVCRVVWVFPWISACSPSGDACDATVGEWTSFLYQCTNGELALLGLPARQSVVDEIATLSGYCLACLGGTMLLASVVWWAQGRYQQHRRRKARRAELYDATARLEKGGQALRPKSAQDSDGWLEPARGLLDVANTLPTEPGKRLAGLVRKIDQEAFNLARDSMRSRWRLRFQQWSLHRALEDVQHTLAQASPSMSKVDPEHRELVQHFCTQVRHTQRVADLRRQVCRLLSDRSFLHAGIGEKGHRIEQLAGGAVPLRLVHWSTLERLGCLPKYGSSTEAEAGAMSAPDLLKFVGAKLKLTPLKAEPHLVTFFLSHRWLRAKGPRRSQHPDSEDNVKASRLVSFARWFMEVAHAHGLLVEVAFWIDYCCTDQEEGSKADLAIAALPLYIASCTKVVSWYTPDFDRRCWTAVERLLAYSFCEGGLTPYVIDESFARGLTVWQFWRDGGGSDEGEGWTDYGPAAQSMLQRGKRLGQKLVVVPGPAGGSSKCEVDLQERSQRDLSTGAVHPIRERGAESATWATMDADVGVVSAPPTPSAGSKSSVTPTSDNRMILHRRSRKLPNPLDFETCRLGQEDDRRKVAQLVDIALAVPALEVFSDRQPVEWGLTEVIEQALSWREALPPELGEVAPDFWVERIQRAPSGAGDAAAGVEPDWGLVLERAGASSGARAVGGKDIGSLVWIDTGLASVPALRPTPAEIDELFAKVDEAMEAKAPDLEDRVRTLLLALKADLQEALAADSAAALEAAIQRARHVELPEKQEATERSCALRLEAALSSTDEPAMRAALRVAREAGAQHLPIYQVVLTIQQRLYQEQLLATLTEQIERATAPGNADVFMLAALYRTALQHGLLHLAGRALQAARAEVESAKVALDIHTLEILLNAATEGDWPEIRRLAASSLQTCGLQQALVKAAQDEDLRRSLAALRAVEKQARDTQATEIENQAKDLIKATAARMGTDMGLPEEWDLMVELAGTDVPRLLKKAEDTAELRERVQRLVDHTYNGWGGLGKMTRTRDRGHEPISVRLEVMSVVHVQNAESFVNYDRARKRVKVELEEMARLDDFGSVAVGDAWDVKTRAISFAGVGKHRVHPTDPMINEHYLWHGTSPAGAESITDTDFDLKKAGTAYGSLFGPGIYFAESCMKADEYTKADSRGWFPLVLCRVVLGHINYCDLPNPLPKSRELENSCKRGNRDNWRVKDGVDVYCGHHSVLGDREKVKRTFREFIVFDNHQVYPEYIVWYQRHY